MFSHLPPGVSTSNQQQQALSKALSVFSGVIVPILKDFTVEGTP